MERKPIRNDLPKIPINSANKLAKYKHMYSGQNNKNNNDFLHLIDKTNDLTSKKTLSCLFTIDFFGYSLELRTFL